MSVLISSHRHIVAHVHKNQDQKKECWCIKRMRKHEPFIFDIPCSQKGHAWFKLESEQHSELFSSDGIPLLRYCPGPLATANVTTVIRIKLFELEHILYIAKHTPKIIRHAAKTAAKKKKRGGLNVTLLLLYPCSIENQYCFGAACLAACLAACFVAPFRKGWEECFPPSPPWSKPLTPPTSRRASRGRHGPQGHNGPCARWD